ncbi:MAG TPA: PEGA domain-containing protein [Kofleriaceae bacterium]|nr:PEGA domain-containing protein [Kofleriaceae bacterium]
MQPIVRVVISTVVMIGAVMGERAQAQPSDANAVAEQLFNQARELAKANRWAEACPSFEASLRADPALGTRLNLAVCYEHIDKLASAWGIFREAIEEATKAGDVKRRDYAQKEADALEPRLPKLTISVPEHPPGGLVVARDGAPIDAGALGVALYVDPGTHAIIVSAPGFEAVTRTVTLVEGQAETLTIPALAAVPVRATALSQELVISPTRKYVAIAASAAGVASISVGLLFGGKANSAYNDAKALCGANLGKNQGSCRMKIHNATELRVALA